MIKIVASIAVVILIIMLAVLKMLQSNFFKVSGDSLKKEYVGFLPYPLKGIEGNADSEKAAARYNKTAKVAIMVMIFFCVVPVVMAMAEYFQK